MKITIEINCDNEAFRDPDPMAGDDEHQAAAAVELHRILRELDTKKLVSYGGMTLWDSNGNDVGAAELWP